MTWSTLARNQQIKHLKPLWRNSSMTEKQAENLVRQAIAREIALGRKIPKNLFQDSVKQLLKLTNEESLDDPQHQNLPDPEFPSVEMPAEMIDIDPIVIH